MANVLLTTPNDPVEISELSPEKTSCLPFYGRTRDQVEALIKSGRLKPGQTIFSEGACAGELRVSKMPVEFTRSLFRGDRYGANVISRREP